MAVSRQYGKSFIDKKPHGAGSLGQMGLAVSDNRKLHWTISLIGVVILDHRSIRQSGYRQRAQPILGRTALPRVTLQ